MSFSRNNKMAGIVTVYRKRKFSEKENQFPVAKGESFERCLNKQVHQFGHSIVPKYQCVASGKVKE